MKQIMYRQIYLFIITALLLTACASTGEQQFQPRAHLSAVEAAGGASSAGFARATVPRLREVRLVQRERRRHHSRVPACRSRLLEVQD